MKSFSRFAKLLPLAILTGVASYFACKSKPAQTEPYFLNLKDSVKYVGIETCRQCHADHYQTFIQTGMGSSFGPADSARIKSDFAAARPVYDKKKDFYYFPFRKNGKMYIQEFRLKGNDTVHNRTEEIKYVIGSGHHTNSHFWMDGEFMHQAPLTWYSQSKKWDLPPGFEEFNSRFSRKIDIECMSCHNGMPEVQEGSVNKFTRLPAGIDCERCHGPGSLHVTEKRSGNIVDTKKEADRSIVNPARLPWKLQVDICQRCHLQGNNVLKPGKKFTDYRPGMHLDSVFEIYMPKYENADVFYMAGHAERLQMSRCFTQSNTGGNMEAYNAKLNLTCITCHNPHVSVRKTNIEKFNAACNNCHGKGGNAASHLCSENPQKLAAVKNNCVSCHMPKSGTGDIPHVTVHDHYIRKPAKTGTNAEPGNPTGLYAVNNKNPRPDMLFKAYVSWFEKWEAKPFYLEKAATLSNSVATADQIHLSYAKSNWTDMLRMVQEINAETADAWTCYRLAKAFDKSGKSDQALTWYRAAVEKMPFNADFIAEAANMLIRSGRETEAMDLLKPALKSQPSHEWLLINMGTASYKTGNLSEALKHWQKAVTINPDNELSRMYLAELYIKTGKTAAARLQLEQALRISPGNAEIRALQQQLQD